MKLLAAATLALLASLSSCNASETYGVDETQTAFEQHGLVLNQGAPPAQPGSAADPWGSGKPAILVPPGDVPFFVFVGSATDAERVWSMYSSQQGSGTFDARRANVLVISDGGLTAADRARVKAALTSLPDKGSPVLVTTGPD